MGLLLDLLVIEFAAPILVNKESCAAAYLIAAGLMGVCLLLTGPAFFRKEPWTCQGDHSISRSG